MGRVAVFVDAGYLFAQGSTALTGSKKPRTTVELNCALVRKALIEFALEKSPGCELLRIYWYDGALASSGLTLDQESLADLDDIKLRLGFINSQGQQKGVDSLIVTDMVELARNSAISDAVLLSGDEDVRVGVHIAQSLGVRVHLLGIVPSRGSQSKQLMFEADTTSELDADCVWQFLTYREPPKRERVTNVSTDEGDAIFEESARELADELDTNDVHALITHWEHRADVPPEFDGKLLARCRQSIGRDLNNSEKRTLRLNFRGFVSARGQASKY